MVSLSATFIPLRSNGCSQATTYFGGMPQEMALQNIRRFAAEVMPAFAAAEAIAL